MIRTEAGRRAVQYVAGVSGGSHRGGARLDKEEEGQCTPVTSTLDTSLVRREECLLLSPPPSRKLTEILRQNRRGGVLRSDLRF